MKRDDIFDSDDSSSQSSRSIGLVKVVKPQPQVANNQKKQAIKVVKRKRDEDECDEELLRIFPFMRDKEQPQKKQPIPQKSANSSSSSLFSSPSEQISSETQSVSSLLQQSQLLSSQRSNSPIATKSSKSSESLPQPQRHQDVFSEKQKLRLILIHFANNNRRTRYSRIMHETLARLKSGSPLQTVLTTLKEYDAPLHTLILKHQRFLSAITQALFYLTRFKYQFIQDTSLSKKIENIYKYIGNQVDVNRFMLGLRNNPVFIFKDSSLEMEEFLQEVESKILSFMEDTKAKKEAQIMIDELWQGEETQPEEEKNEKKEEMPMNPIRMKRTMLMLMRCGFNFTSSNLQFGQDLSTFLLKIIEIHAEKLTKDIFKATEISSTKRTDQDQPYDQVSYFQAKYSRKKSQQQSESQPSKVIHPLVRPNPTIIEKLDYPDILKIYNSLRRKECELQNALQSSVSDVVSTTLFANWNRSTRKKAIRDYYFTPIPNAIIDDFIDQPDHAQPSKRTTVQLQHILYVLDSHLTYSKHQVTWKMRNVYD